jgi:hypothetical protein
MFSQQRCAAVLVVVCTVRQRESLRRIFDAVRCALRVRGQGMREGDDLINPHVCSAGIEMATGTGGNDIYLGGGELALSKGGCVLTLRACPKIAGCSANLCGARGARKVGGVFTTCAPDLGCRLWIFPPPPCGLARWALDLVGSRPRADGGFA